MFPFCVGFLLLVPLICVDMYRLSGMPLIGSVTILFNQCFIHSLIGFWHSLNTLIFLYICRTFWSTASALYSIFIYTTSADTVFHCQSAVIYFRPLCPITAFHTGSIHAAVDERLGLALVMWAVMWAVLGWGRPHSFAVVNNARSGCGVRWRPDL